MMPFALMSDYNADDVARLAARRRAHVADREYWQGVQRELGRDNRVLARIASDEAAYHGRLERTITWAISYIEGRAPAYKNDRLVLPSAEMASIVWWEMAA
jgi:hypothetical protein